uniref:Uncharacterized protein n=1 Tax=Micrurus paraensis TaxID=1970185 RepID=A0A2D4K3T4_9SAUR
MPHFGTIIGHFIVKKNIYINNNINPKGSGYYGLYPNAGQKNDRKVHFQQNKASHLKFLKFYLQQYAMLLFKKGFVQSPSWWLELGVGRGMKMRGKKKLKGSGFCYDPCHLS